MVGFFVQFSDSALFKSSESVMNNGIEALFGLAVLVRYWEKYQLFKQHLELEQWPWVISVEVAGRGVMKWLKGLIVECYYIQEGVTNVLFQSPSDFGCEGLPEGRGFVF
jgi:hypothetical protein